MRRGEKCKVSMIPWMSVDPDVSCSISTDMVSMEGMCFRPVRIMEFFSVDVIPARIEGSSVGPGVRDHVGAG